MFQKSNDNCAVQKQAFEYASSILEGNELMVALVKHKNQKEKVQVLAEWKKIEKQVYKKKKVKIVKKHWSDILKTQ